MTPTARSVCATRTTAEATTLLRLGFCTLGAVIVTATLAFAAGSDSSTPPKSTRTTTECKTGQVWDTKIGACVDVKSYKPDADSLYDTVRELAYADRFDDARVVMAAMDQQDDRVMTYQGFIARKQGDWNSAVTYYTAAIDTNPDNMLARSYMGQGHVTRGERDQAQAQLSEIRTRGGAGTWAETALAAALKTGRTYNY